MHKLLLTISLLFISNLNSMHIENGATKITFNNQTKSIGTWLQMCLLKPDHPFNRTKTYYYSNKAFIETGTVASLNKKDMAAISNGKAFFYADYELVKTSHYGNTFKQIGVLLLGTGSTKAVYEFYSTHGISLDGSLTLKSKL